MNTFYKKKKIIYNTKQPNNLSPQPNKSNDLPQTARKPNKKKTQKLHPDFAQFNFLKNSLCNKRFYIQHSHKGQKSPIMIMLTLLFKKGCNNAKSHPNISKLKLFPIQLNPLFLQGKSNQTGSLCQPFPMSQQAHSSPQHFCSLAQQALCISRRAKDRQLVPYPQQPHPPATPSASSPFLPAHTSCSLILPSSRKAGERRKQQTRRKGKGHGG